MSILDKIIKLQPKAPRITLFGKPGVGKSTLAAQFPNPLFVLTEETGLKDAPALDVSTSFREVWSNIKELSELKQFPFETIVVDSITKLDALIIKHILDEEPIQKGGKAATLNSACGGYGGGVLRAESLHRAFKGLMDRFQDKGITVIYISHVCITKIKSPDNEDYDVFNITMNHDKSRSVYIDDVDMVGFCRLKAFMTETESGRHLMKSTNDRIIVTGSSEVNVSKNRFAMPTEIPMKAEEIMKYIPFYQLQTQE